MAHFSKRNNGFTLIEILVTVVVLGIVVAAAVPSIQSLLQNNYAASITNEFVATLNLARSEAVKRRATVKICTSDNGTSCRTSSDSQKLDWERGWIIMDVSNGNTVLRYIDDLQGGANLAATVSEVSYEPSGATLSGATTFNLTIPGCFGDNNRDIEIGVTGRISVERVAC